MKLNRAEFLSAVIAIAATTGGCNKLKAELTQASPETVPVTQPAPGAAPAAPAGNIDQAPVRPDTDDTTGQGTSASTKLRSPVKEAGTFASPVKEAGLASPVKEAGLASPVKEAKIGSPVKEAGMASPVKEAGYGSPVKESLIKKPSPVKEM
jgi:hypothetical protein